MADVANEMKQVKRLSKKILQVNKAKSAIHLFNTVYKEFYEATGVSAHEINRRYGKKEQKTYQTLIEQGYGKEIIRILVNIDNRLTLTKNN